MKRLRMFLERLKVRGPECDRRESSLVLIAGLVRALTIQVTVHGQGAPGSTAHHNWHRVLPSGDREQLGLVLSGEGTRYQTSICRGSTRPCFYNGHLSPGVDPDGYLHLKCQDHPLLLQPLHEPGRRRGQGSEGLPGGAQRQQSPEPSAHHHGNPDHQREKLPRSPPFSSCKRRAGAPPHPGPWGSPGVVTTTGGAARKRSKGVSPGPRVCGKEPLQMRTEGSRVSPRGLRIAPGSGPGSCLVSVGAFLQKRCWGFI